MRLRMDTVVLANGLALRPPILLGAGRHLELSVGRPGRAGRGAAIGALLGAVAGGVIADATYKPPPCNPDPNNFLGCFDVLGKGPSVAGGAFLGLLAGALVGAIIGKNSGPERWIAVPSGQVGMVRSRSGAAVLAGHVSF